jgi:hypothetical protein
MPQSVVNAISTCFTEMWGELEKLNMNNYSCRNATQFVIEREVWIHFLNMRIDEFRQNGGYSIASVYIISDHSIPWYEKLDLIEFVLRYLDHLTVSQQAPELSQMKKAFVKALNFEFERLNYGYRVVDTEVVEITSDAEIETINKAVEDSKDNVKEHLNKAIAHYAERPNPDVRNSIKESISAVETVCRELTGESTLGAALKKLESKGIKVQNQLRTAFTQLYAYTNNPDTGIRHALMDDTGDYVPTAAEAYYMIVSCSAFINYLRQITT